MFRRVRFPPPPPDLIFRQRVTDDLNSLLEADLYIIAVSDAVIAEIAAQLPFKNRLVVHTAGSVSLNALDDNNRKGVFYPLQTFSKNKEVDFRTIPICLESENATDYQLLDKVAKSISEKIFAINSEQRQALHVAAVFVNNFTNHLLVVAEDILKRNNLKFDFLKPLIMETILKIVEQSPSEVQTGPAVRGDVRTINAHLAMLEYMPEYRGIYKLMSESIVKSKKI